MPEPVTPFTHVLPQHYEDELEGSMTANNVTTLWLHS